MSESHWMIFIGILLFPIAALGFKKPELFMRGRRSGFWLKLLGEEKTKKFIQYFSVPIVLLIAIFLIVVGLSTI
jgi:hypothetical protein